MKIKKINKFFMLIMLSVIVFAGTAFEAQAFNWKDYVPNVSAWATNFANKLSQYKNMFLAFILRKETRPLIVDKVAIMDNGSLNYTIMFDRMQNFKNDMNRRELCQFMQQFVQNYVKSSDQEKALLEVEHDLFNITLKELRDNNVSWLEITCLNDIKNRQDKQYVWNVWAFLSNLKTFNTMWLEDKALDLTIQKIEEKLTEI